MYYLYQSRNITTRLGICVGYWILNRLTPSLGSNMVVITGIATMLADLNGVSAERRCHHIPLYSTTSDPVIFTSKNHVTAFKICSTTPQFYILCSVTDITRTGDSVLIKNCRFCLQYFHIPSTDMATVHVGKNTYLLHSAGSFLRS